MPQTKQQLLEEAKKLGLKVSPDTKMADIRDLISQANNPKPLIAEKKDNQKEHSETAKAGKRSAKAIREKEEETTKKSKLSIEKDNTKNIQKPTRSRLERRSKGYRIVANKIESDKSYDLNEAINLVKNSSPVKFDASIELHVNLNVDPRQAEQNIRDNVVLPAGSGRKIRIAALTDEPKIAIDAGADIAGNDDLIQQIDKGKIDFDILIASPANMPKLGKYAKVLGPKGLMPNPKSGTVTNDIQKAVAEAKAGRVEYRVDSSGIIHLAIGKASFEDNGLKDNISAVFNSIKANKPSSVKSNYVKSVYLTTTMGPSIKVDLVSLNDIS